MSDRKKANSFITAQVKSNNQENQSSSEKKRVKLDRKVYTRTTKPF